jgi:FtsH-binding integral membrane protein
MVLILQILYAIVFFIMLLLSGFIIFHVVFYSYNSPSKKITLALFVPVTCVLLLTNLILFNSIDLEGLFSNIYMLY